MSRAHRLGRYVIESEEWLAARQSGVGGSDVAAILGISPWVSTFALWHAKAGNIPAEVLTDEPLYWGKALEKVVLARWREEHPEHGAANWQGYTWTDPDQPWRHANPDFIATSPTRSQHEIVEIKTSAFADEWGPSGSTIVPPWYLTQLLWYLDILNARWGWLAVLIGGNDYREYRIDTRDHADDIAFIRAQTERFWRSVQDGETPPIDGADSTYRTIRKLHPDIDDEQIEIPAGLAARLVESKAAKEAAEISWTQSLALAADSLGSAKTGTLCGLKIVGRRARRTREGEWGMPYVLLDRKAEANYQQYLETSKEPA